MVEFYEELGFSISLRVPEQGEAGYVTMVRDEAELAIVAAEWPARQTSLEMGTEPRFEMFVYVDDLEETVEALRSRGAPGAPGAHRPALGRAHRVRDRPRGQPGLAGAGVARPNIDAQWRSRRHPTWERTSPDARCCAASPSSSSGATG